MPHLVSRALQPALELAVEAARAAGDLLRADFHRAGGPRGKIDKAEADVEAEHAIRARLRAAFPDWGYLGEETGAAPGAGGAPVWLVDPNDGTRDYLKGRRGSSVSIGLVHAGQPVLGVVYAFGYPDDRGDLFTWAEGCGPVRRNGRAVTAVLPPRLGPHDSVLVSSKGDRHPTANLQWSEPARYRAVPSIAHRLALVAVGEGALATSLYAPGAWDYAAGHALVRGAGGVLLNQHGDEIGYAPDGQSRASQAFAGAHAAAAEMGSRAWRRLDGPPHENVVVATLRPGEAVADAGLLSRAQGCLLGQIAGDSLGSLVEFESAAALAARPGGAPRRLADGGAWNTLAGQPTDDSELALALARSIVAQGGYDAQRARGAYQSWLLSQPFDVGRTTRAALEGRLLVDSQANGALMRASPLGLLAHALPAADAAALARADAALTHPHAVCADASAAYLVALTHALRAGDGAEAAHAAALDWARGAPAHPDVTAALERARDAPSTCDGEHQGFVLLALQNAFHALLHAGSLEDGVVETVARGGDTDTNAAVAGALLGAVYGRTAIPDQWRLMVLSCRAHPARAARPRPAAYWPTDALELAERLLLAGRR